MANKFFIPLPSEDALGPDFRDWTGKGRHYSIAVLRQEEPFMLRLRWYEGRPEMPCLVGHYKVDMVGLRTRHLTVRDREKGQTHDRFQFIRNGNSIYLQPSGPQAESEFIGMVRTQLLPLR